MNRPENGTMRNLTHTTITTAARPRARRTARFVGLVPAMPSGVVVFTGRKETP